MQYQQEQVVKVLDNAAEFAREFQAELGSSVAVANLAAARTALVSGAVTQDGLRATGVSGTRTKQELRERVVGQMVPIMRIARTRWDQIPVPAMTEFVVPAASASDVTVLTRAEAMATAATSNYEVLRHDLGDSFVDDLRAAATALHDAILRRDTDKARCAGATVSVDLRVQEALRVIEVMTAVVERTFAGRPDVVAEFRKRTRIPRKPGVPRGRKKPDGAPAAPPEGGAPTIA